MAPPQTLVFVKKFENVMSAEERLTKITKECGEKPMILAEATANASLMGTRKRYPPEEVGKWCTMNGIEMRTHQRLLVPLAEGRERML